MMKTYRNKVKWLLKYCSEYDGHEYMYDEHVRDEDRFDIELDIEKKIYYSMNQASIIVLTGDAGDGKSRILNRLQTKACRDGKLWECINDFSALNDCEKRKVLNKMEDILENNSPERLLIAANSGIFMGEMMQYKKGLLRKLETTEGCIIIDFTKRNLASDKNEFNSILKSFLDCSDCSACEGCSVSKCPFKHNLKMLTEETVVGDEIREQLRMVYYVLFIKGVHVTFRDFLSSLAYAVTKGLTCKEISEEMSEENYTQMMYYNNLFHYKEEKNKLLIEIEKLDPAKKDHKNDRRLFYDRVKKGVDVSIQKEHFKSLIRQMYFENPQELQEDDADTPTYSLLNLEYIEEYSRVIDKIKKDGFLDATDECHAILWKFELGINRIFHPERSDAQLVLFDAPLIISPKVRIEHETGEEMLVCFYKRDYEADSTGTNLLGNDMNSFLCVSFVENDDSENPFMEKMVVDYELFRQIMMASENRYDISIMNKADDMRIKNFISRTFQHVSHNKKVRVKWLGDAQLQYMPFELYSVRQTGIRHLQNKEKSTKTYRVGKG